MPGPACIFLLQKPLGVRNRHLLVGAVLLATAILAGPRAAAGTAGWGLSPLVIRSLAPDPPADADAAPDATANGANVDDANAPIAIAHESWEGVLDRFSRALVDPVARAGEEPLFMPGRTVWRFGDDEAGLPRAIAERFDGLALISVRAAEHPTGEAFSGLAGDLERAAGLIHPTVRRALLPPPRARASAETTLSRWVESSLDLQAGDRYGVIFLAEPPVADLLIPTDRPAGAAVSSSPFERVTVLLVKASRKADGRWRLAQVRYGTLVEAVRHGF